MRTSQESAVPAQLKIGKAHLHEDTHLEGVKARFGKLHRGGALTLAAQILETQYEGHAEKKGFFRSSSMRTRGYHQQALSTQLDVGVLKDVGEVEGPLVLRSSMLNFMTAQTHSEIQEETAYLKHMDHTETKVSGLSLPWFSDPRPALQKSLQALGEASSTTGRSVAAIQTATNALRLVGDTTHLIQDGGAAVPQILLGTVSKLATLSIGVRKESQTVTRSEPVPNEVKGGTWTIENEKTHFEGQHDLRKLNLKTKNGAVLDNESDLGWGYEKMQT